MVHQELPQTFYDAVGGAETFRIVSRFYDWCATTVASDVPAKDLQGAEDRLRMFLEQYWGGPRTCRPTRPSPAADAARLTRWGRSSGTPTCMHTAVASIDAETSTRSTAANCSAIWRWPRSTWSTPSSDSARF